MEEKKFCPKCEKTRPVKAVQQKETLPVRDAKIDVLSQVTVCSVCGEVFATEAQEEENIRQA